MKTLERREIYSTYYRDIEHLRLNMDPFIGQYHDGARAPVDRAPVRGPSWRDREKPNEPVHASPIDDITLGVF